MADKEFTQICKEILALMRVFVGRLRFWDCKIAQI